MYLLEKGEFFSAKDSSFILKKIAKLIGSDTNEALGDALGITSTTVAQIKNEENIKLSLRCVERVAKRCKKTVAVLISGKIEYAEQCENKSRMESIPINTRAEFILGIMSLGIDFFKLPREEQIFFRETGMLLESW